MNRKYTNTAYIIGIDIINTYFKYSAYRFAWLFWRRRTVRDTIIYPFLLSHCVLWEDQKNSDWSKLRGLRYYISSSSSTCGIALLLLSTPLRIFIRNREIERERKRNKTKQYIMWVLLIWYSFCILIASIAVVVIVLSSIVVVVVVNNNNNNPSSGTRRSSRRTS